MAYINAQEVKAIRDLLKKELPEYKFSVRKSSGSHSVDVTFVSGPAFKTHEVYDRYEGKMTEINFNEGYNTVNHHWIKESVGEENAPVFEKVVDIIKTAPFKAGVGDLWFDKSDMMSDYFHTAYYFSVAVGKAWNDGYKAAA